MKRVLRRAANAGQHLGPFLVVGALLIAFLIVVPDFLEPGFVNYQSLNEGELTEAQEQTATMVKELNSYLISLTTLIFGGFGWYVTQYPPALHASVTRTIFFAAVGFMSLAGWYAFQTYAQIAAELAQDALALVPGQSRILYYLQLEASACGIGTLLLMFVFADAVTRKRGK